jgi:hypothetical protein
MLSIRISSILTIAGKMLLHRATSLLMLTSFLINRAKSVRGIDEIFSKLEQSLF